jgi:Predicted sugar kinase
MKGYRRVGVIVRKSDPGVTITLARVCTLLRELGSEVLVDADPRDCEIPDGARRCARADLVREADLALVIGGDGTLLDAGRSLAGSGVPVLGINLGRLGFLADVPAEAMAEVLRSVFRGAFSIEERLMLEITPCGDSATPTLAVNDVVLRSLGSIRMLDFETWLDGEFVSSHRADGLIAATPTGSTAYALSGGGPILHPALDTLLLVPICPHALSDRPVVVPASMALRIRLVSGQRAGIAADGQLVCHLDAGDEVEIRRAPHPLRLMHPQGHSHFRLLREKLSWGHGHATTAANAG